jgi:phosphoglycerate dehydrogenase-like enzyme
MGKILLGIDADILSDETLAQIKTLAPEKSLLITQDQAEVERHLEDIEIAVRWFPRDLLPKASGLRWMQQWGAGADWLMEYPEAAAMDFVLTNASGVHAVPISEHILAFLLSFARGLHVSACKQVRHEWKAPDQPQVFELADKTMVLVGVGAIGERTAMLANALEMHVLGVRRDPDIPAPGVIAMYGPDHLLDLLSNADFVVLTIPLTPETQDMIGERELRAMKPSAYIVNIGRGDTIDEAVLIRALEEGWIAGAGLDVFETEPLPQNSPLWDMENVIITAHYSGRTPKYNERAMAIFLDNLRRYQAGAPLRNVVDKTLGY